MPITPLGSVITGTATTLKLSAKDAGVQAKAAVDRAVQKAKATKLIPGMIKYTARGEGVFNCFTDSGQAINFSGGHFFLSADNPDRDDIIKSLAHFVRTKRILKEEG